MTTTLRFPDGFVWGAAAAAYQIEGAVAEDGRLPSIWDTFSHTPGAVDGGDTGDVACDHYHRWEEDLDLMVRLGLPSYRFSVSWARVVPDGRTVNPAGLDFYKRLVDGLLARGITPLATLYHWDLPQALQDTGGWLDRGVADRFADYAAAVGKELGDRVPTVTTLNEPWCSAYLGHATGEHAPGLRDNALAYPAAHHLNLAHGRAVAALRSVLPPRAEVSVTLNLAQVYPATDSPEDRAAARHADAVANRIFLDPMLRGHYPEELLEGTRHLTDWSFVADGDLAEIHAPVDSLGVNYYSPHRIAAPGSHAGGAPRLVPGAASSDAFWPGTDRAVVVPIPGPRTPMDWPIVPGGLTDLLVGVHREYGVPLLVTENGCACEEEVGPDGVVHDRDRIDYLRGHLAAVHAAIEAGADVRGYYVWTLLDNFEWAWGYAKRFGLVRVDYDDQSRTPKDSAHWYAEVVRGNALTA